jgi:hypothetical protein
MVFDRAFEASIRLPGLISKATIFFFKELIEIVFLLLLGPTEIVSYRA